MQPGYLLWTMISPNALEVLPLMTELVSRHSYCPAISPDMGPANLKSVVVLIRWPLLTLNHWTEFDTSGEFGFWQSRDTKSSPSATVTGVRAIMGGSSTVRMCVEIGKRVRII